MRHGTSPSAQAADSIGRLGRTLRTSLQPHIFAVDGVGYLPLEREKGNLVFQLISGRYEKGSTILTSNKSFSRFGQVFHEEVLATGILDRLLHHAEVVPTNDPSHRFKNRLTAIDGETGIV